MPGSIPKLFSRSRSGRGRGHRRTLPLLLLGALGAGPLAGQTVQDTTTRPLAPLAGIQARLGFYRGPAGDILMLEDSGQLILMPDSTSRVHLSPDGGNWRARDGAMAGARVRFEEQGGRITAVQIGEARYARRAVGPEAGGQLKVQVVRPVPELIQEALAATPPAQPEGLRSPDLVELVRLDSTIHLDIRYATTNNFAGTVFYASPQAFLQRPAAEALVRAGAWLRQRGYGLLVHDGYRPWYVTKAFWDAVPDSLHWLVADPSRGSRHNRGSAVDLTLYDLKTGQPVEMPGTYDEATPRSFANYPGGTARQRWHRALLRTAMVVQGFIPNPEEWWHFDYKEWREYPVLNIPFEEITN